MNAYCSRQGKALSTLRFLYDGDRISDNDTPEDVLTTPCCLPVMGYVLIMVVGYGG